MQAVPTQAYAYLHENGGLYTYNFAVAFPVAYNQGSYLDVPVPDLTYAASSPESIASPRTPDVVATSLPLQQTSKKPRSRRSKDPNHVGRPANSFMIFRSEHNAVVQKSGNAHKINQQDISRDAALLWKNFSSAEKQRYVDAAAEQSRKQREYRESHPDGLYSKPSKKRDSTSIRRARAQKPYDRSANKTAERVNAKNDNLMPLETAQSSTAVPGPSPDQWLGLEPSQFIDPILTQCIPANVVDQTGYAALNPDPQFDLNLDWTYWQPKPPMPPTIDTTAQLALPPADQDLNPINFDNCSLSNETTNIITGLLDDQTVSTLDQQLIDQFFSDLEASQQS